MNRTDSDCALKSLTAIAVAIVGSLVCNAAIALMFMASERHALAIGGGELGAAIALCAALLVLWMRGAPRQVLMWGPYFVILPLNISAPLIAPFETANLPTLSWSAAGGLVLFVLWFAIGLSLGAGIVRRTNRTGIDTTE